MAKKYTITEIEGRKLKLSNLEKILYPSVAVSKAHVIQYYINVAPFMLPFVEDRPMTLIRYPDGVLAERFYSKNKPDWTPDWVDSVEIDTSDDNIYMLVNNTATLAWMSNLASLEYHPMTIKSKHLDSPDHFIFDLDPDESIDFEQVKEVAQGIKVFLESMNYMPYVKTSGSKGLHIYVPILPKYKQSVVIETVRDIATQYVKSNPLATLSMSKERRKGKILIDILRNNKSQTCVAPYSTRGKTGCPISTPLLWNELNDLKRSDQFNILNIKDRLDTVGNVWEGYFNNAQPLHTDKNVIIDTNKATQKTDVSNMENISHNPMLASAGSAIPSAKKYLYEIKWDGIRVIIIKNDDNVTIKSRKGNDITAQFPIIEKHCKNIQHSTLIADGEIVVLDSDGLPNFGKTVGRLHLQGEHAIAKTARSNKAALYLFDVLYMDGVDVRFQDIEVRRAKLKQGYTATDHLRYSESFPDGAILFEAIKDKAMEGIMCKRRGSVYQSDQRSKDWLKIKVRSTDTAYVIGYTEGNGDRTGYFGSLHLAKKEGSQWLYMGKVGSGFSSDQIKEISILLIETKTTEKLISNRVEEETKTTWVYPIYMAHIRYASLTANQTYREPVFISIKKVEK